MKLLKNRWHPSIVARLLTFTIFNLCRFVVIIATMETANNWPNTESIITLVVIFTSGVLVSNATIGFANGISNTSVTAPKFLVVSLIEVYVYLFDIYGVVLKKK